jgi:hypothetical protein
MKTGILFFSILVAVLFSSCEKEKTRVDVIDFEKFELDETGYWNGSDGSGGVRLGNAFFPNVYNSQWQSWYGFSVSSVTDNETPGYINQYSSIEGSGDRGSGKYAVLYSFSSDTITFNVPAKVINISLSNSTYAYYSMLNGDDFNAKFGGESGDEPDYFSLIIEGIDESGNITGTAEISLADYRNLNGVPDFIGNAWTEIDLSAMGFLKHLVFAFDSSRKNEFGILTPTYVCIDNIRGELEE